MAGSEPTTTRSRRGITRRSMVAGMGATAAALPMARLLDGSPLGGTAHAQDGAASGGPGATAAHDRLHLGTHGDDAPVDARADALDHLLYPPPRKPFRAGAVREFDIEVAIEEIEVAKGVYYEAWAMNGSVPGPVLRVNEGETLRVNLVNGTPHPHTLHFHGIHPAAMDGVFELVGPGKKFTYEFEAKPAGVHPYHCHVAPLAKHIAKGMYGTLIVDPRRPRRKARELVLVMNGFDTDGDSENNFYTVNGIAFFHARHPIPVKLGELVRIYLVNMTEFDLINSFHLHGEFFRYQESGHPSNAWRHTDTVALCQGERGVIELEFSNSGKFMFHAHQTEFTDLGWVGFFDVQE
jgi:FtsP/CotA-like multicopper oxidase with cupredoxin domain